jgi:uncharacterized protein YprB with RNaseH-like and TPR domain
MRFCVAGTGLWRQVHAVLCRTFCHVPGIGRKLEERLWAAGLVSWEAVASAGGDLEAGRREDLVRYVEESRRQLAAGNAGFFAGTLPTDEHWRLYPEFRGSVAYVDIETTGLGGPGDYVTTIALYDGKAIRHYVHGQNLAEFACDIQGYRLLVTYNGKCFDLPFLRAALGLTLDQAHIDLRYVLASLGHRGGLKSCERQLGLDRGDLADVDGFFAVLLWEEYRRHGNAPALETLLAYNIRDVVNLEALLVMAYNRKVARTPFGATLELPPPLPPPEPFRAHLPTVQRLLARYPAVSSW